MISSKQRAQSVQFRRAQPADIPRLHALIQRSARALTTKDYSPAQVEAALQSAWGVDSQLIADQTYFIAEHEAQPVACGGWSFRGTLFGADTGPDRVPTRLDPTREPARIRAFFVHPDWARQGLGRTLLEYCERAASKEGFKCAQLVATLPGMRLYAACGYQPGEARDYPLAGGLTIWFITMAKDLTPP